MYVRGLGHQLSTDDGMSPESTEPLSKHWFVVDKTWWHGQQNKQIFIVPCAMIGHPYPNLNYCGACILFYGVGSNETMFCVRI